MQRITISIDDKLAETFDEMIQARAYRSRSEALRDIVRNTIEHWRRDDKAVDFCVASLSYVYDKRVRSLADKLSTLQHEHHDLVASSTTVRLDHYHSMETIMMKGRAEDVRHFADTVQAQRGLQFAKLNMVAVEPSDDHDDPDSHEHDEHRHMSPILA